MSKGSILVVDDESEIREGLELLLASEGYGVFRTATVSTCCAKFAGVIRSSPSC
jgi:CheY-like chemotaxis protein